MATQILSFTIEMECPRKLTLLVYDAYKILRRMMGHPPKHSITKRYETIKDSLDKKRLTDMLKLISQIRS